MCSNYLQPVYEYLTRTLLRLTRLDLASTAAVDIGGGNGQWLEFLLQKGLKYGSVLDIDPEKIAEADTLLRENFSEERWQTINADVVSIPVVDDSFELVVSRSSLHLWPDAIKAWQEIARITRPGGFVFVGRGYGPDLPDDLRQTVKKEKKMSHGDGGDSFQEPPSMPVEELEEIIKNAGFAIIEIIPDHKAHWVLAVRNL